MSFQFRADVTSASLSYMNAVEYYSWMAWHYLEEINYRIYWEYDLRDIKPLQTCFGIYANLAKFYRKIDRVQKHRGLQGLGF